MSFKYFRTQDFMHLRDEQEVEVRTEAVRLMPYKSNC